MKRLSSSLINLVDILSDGEYHDGTTLGDKLAMSRSAIWKNIQKLLSYGVKIEAVKAKGYALLEPLILLNTKKITEKLSDKTIQIDVVESMTSTNDYFKAFKPVKTMHVCLAEEQTEGRGRLHRQWCSPFGENIYFSCAYPFHKEVSELSGLSLVVSLAVLKTIENYLLSDHAFVKWPNDILCHDKKLSGNLIEIQAESYGECQAIIGIGLNVNMLTAESSLQWTSLRDITGQYIDRNELCAHLIENMLLFLREFEQGGLSLFIDRWGQADYLKGKNISLKIGQQKISGIAQGITALGHIILDTLTGRQTYSSGDATVCKGTKSKDN